MYHPIFIDQAYRLLRATCVYCTKFRLPRRQLYKYECKLRLIQHGLIHEAHLLDTIGEQDWATALDSDSEAEDDDENSDDSVIRKINKFVKRCLQRGSSKRGDLKNQKHEGASEMRRHVVKQFLAEITKTRKCTSCGGVSPAYRKDRAVKVFEKPLSDKEKASMAQKGLKREDVLAQDRKTSKKVQEAEINGVDDMDVDSDEAADAIEKTSSASSSQRYISPMEVQARITALFHHEQTLLSLLYNTRPPTRKSTKTTCDMFFISTVLVPPNRYRPEARLGDSQVSEAQQNSLYKGIIRGCHKIGRLHEALSNQTADIPTLYQAWAELQESVNSLIDSTQNPVQGAAAARNEEGIKQKLEKKEGLFRKNMMGKRVNYAARSVISPDPNIETNEIGVPPVFAKKLTYPEPVTSHNFREMQQAVMNGVHKWPGASAIENENGQVVNLRNKSAEERMSLANQLLASTNTNATRSGTIQAKNKKVYRHLTNGDVVLMNRQPTLHKPSIMGHRVRVLPGEKTIRMHYANCNTYNADFDGDEMNMHFPQSETARTEALQIADTDHQYLSGTAGKPLRGLIQDHISVSVTLCSKDTYFTRSDYQQLIYSALRPESGHIFGERIELVTPAVIKPVPRWTGKQVITTILKNIQPRHCGPLTMTGQTQLKPEQWGKGSEEGIVSIADGEFVTGILDKSQIGPSSGGLVHAIHEVYGPAVAGKFLSCLGRLLTKCLNMWAFSCGMDDLRLTKGGELARLKALEPADSAGLTVASEYVSLEGNKDDADPILLERLEEALREDSKQEGLDLLTVQAVRGITDDVASVCLPDGLSKPFPANQMQKMTTSGAKGSRVNASLISCNLGQQVLEGRRVPIMVSGKSLPCFRPFETDIRAHGYIVSRFLTGIRPQEYYFHHMAGREGLIDTAVKTSRSGYLQRCLIKGLEGISVNYDNSVRDADGTVVQFLYGEDGLDVSKQQYLTDFDFVLQNVVSEAAQLMHDPGVSDRLAPNRKTFQKYMKSAIKHAKAGTAQGKDPLISAYNPATNAFATSEKFFEAMSTYLGNEDNDIIKSKKNENEPQLARVKINKKNAEMLLAMKYLRSLVEPGEAVGIVAGQSIGEPSTQMTLNTFHLAGHAAKNVTAGIPRLREVLMTASAKISTPAMSLQPSAELSDAEAEQFAKSISAVPLSYVLDGVTVEERVGKGKMYGQARTYVIQLKFFPSAEYTKTYAVTTSDVLQTIEKKLIRRIIKSLKVEMKKRQNQSSATPEIGVSAGTIEMATTAAATDAAGGEDDEDDDGDGDATNAKQKAKKLESVSYESDDEGEEGVRQAAQRESSPVNDIDDDDTGSADKNSKSQSTSEDSDESEDEDGGFSDEDSGSARKERVLDGHSEVVAFDCDEKKGEWCNLTLEYDSSTPKVLLLNIVRGAVAKTMIREIPGVGQCTFMKDEKKNERSIQVAGANIPAMQAYQGNIEVNKIQTNDIVAVLGIYGVEACRNTIVKEVAGVFGSHGIKVDNRHLTLIADHMTRSGGYTPFNRIGLRGNVSPFTKMSFETTLAFLKDALLDGDWDNLASPSSRLVMGRLGKLGTGGFDVLTQLPTVAC